MIDTYTIVGLPSGQLYEADSEILRVLHDFQLVKFNKGLGRFVFRDADEKIVKCYIFDEDRSLNVF